MHVDSNYLHKRWQESLALASGAPPGRKHENLQDISEIYRRAWLSQKSSLPKSSTND